MITELPAIARPLITLAGIPPLVVVLMCVAAACAAFILLTYGRRLWRVAAERRACDAEALPADDATMPDVSVVVHAPAGADAGRDLEGLLPDILAQQYRGRMEVIVVNEGQSEATEEVVARLQQHHPNLYVTFTPAEARNLSQKKLALTLGVKAARYGVIAAVDADTRIRSPHWLTRMCRHLAADPQCQVVLGATVWRRADDRQHGRRLRAWDMAAMTVTWLAAALRRKPYRGTSHNLVYRRQAFFDNRGFSRSLNLRPGDDDIFVSEIARPGNTAVELSADSITTMRAHGGRRAYREERQRRAFTAPYLRRGPSLAEAAASWSFWMGTLCAVAAAVVGYPNLLPLILMAVLGTGLWATVVVLWRRALAALRSRRLLFTLPWFIMTRPVHTLAHKLNARRHRRRAHTWTMGNG